MKQLLLIVALFCAANTALWAQPANDDCSGAIEIMLDANVEFSTIGASDVGPNVMGCGGFTPAENDSIPADIWFTYTATADGFLEWSNCGTADYDSRMAVYAADDACSVTNDDLIACNDDGTACADNTSEMLFPATAGQTYILRLGGYADATIPATSGTGTVTLTVRDDILPNDFCATATTITLGEDQPITNVGATTDGPSHPGNEVCFGFNFPTMDADVWFDYTADLTGTVRFNLCGSISFDSRIAVYAPGSACPPEDGDLLFCNDVGTDATCPPGQFHSDLFFDVVEGETYKIRVGGFATGGQGSGTFDFTEETPPEPPSNDLCENAIPVDIVSFEEAENGDGFVSGTTVAATIPSSGFIPPACANPTGDFASVWYSFESNGNEEVQVDISRLEAGSNFIVELFTDCDTRIDTTGGNNCSFVVDDVSFISDTVTGLPAGESVTILVRVMTFTIFDPAGGFALQVSGATPSRIRELSVVENFTMFPNPVGEYATIDFNLKRAKDLSLDVIDMLGRKVETVDLGQLRAGPQRYTFSTSQLQSGMYTLWLNDGLAGRQIKMMKR
ncbi:MAG: T9SS type A sorting domain-containing protein [Bacteroidota bacterium]